MSNLTTPPKQWLAETFEFEFCAECGGDACHHEAIPFMGNWFAQCQYEPRVADDALTFEYHPTIAAYRELIS